MKGFLALAAEFIDHLVNPTYGVDTNEAYAARLSSVFSADAELAGNLRACARELGARDVDLLPKNAWHWFLGWLASQGERPPDEFLYALYEHHHDLVTRLRIVEYVTTFPKTVDATRALSQRRAIPIHDLPDRWLAGQLLATVEQGDEAAAQQWFLLLIQVGNPPAVMAARSFLQHEWPRRTALVEVAAMLFRDLDQDTRAIWLEMLGLH